MECRALELSDVDALAQLHKSCFPQSPWRADQIASSLNLPTTLSMALFEGGNLVAFLLLQKAADECEILSLAVDPAKRRRGHAKALFASFLKLKSSPTLLLEVAEDNSAAIKLYESLGFSLFSRRKDYYLRENGRVDALNYRLELKG